MPTACSRIINCVLILFCVIICAPKHSFGQAVSINTTGSTADSSAILDVESTTQGLLIPRMDSLQRQAISNPAEGLLVYDLDTRSFWYFQDSAWTDLNEVNRIFESSEGIIATRAGYIDNDFVVGSPQTDGDGNIDHNVRMFFHQGKRAFRAGATLDSSFADGGVTVGDVTAWDEDSLGYHSVAMGFNAKAKGLLAAISLGENTRASGRGSMAAGSNTTATGSRGAMALGYLTDASGDFGATALGYETRASGDRGATALGYNTEASGSSGATALGDQTKATGIKGATALGSFSNATGQNGSIAIGRFCNSSGQQGSIAIGLKATATGNFGAVALGSDVEASGLSAIVIGSGLPSGGPGTLINNIARSLMVGFDSDIPTLFVGPGNSTPGSLGKVGIGTTSPGAGASSNTRLEVKDGHVILSNNFGVFSRNAANNALGAGFDTHPDDHLRLFAGGSAKATVLSDGKVGIGTEAPNELVTIESGSAFARNLGSSDTNKGFLLGENSAPGFGFVYDGTGGGGDNKAYIKEMIGDETSVVMTFKGDGNVGVGTTTPDTKMEVEGSGIITSRITSSNNSEVRLEFKRAGGGTDWRIKTTSGLLLFGQSTNDFTSVTDIFRIGSSYAGPAADNSFSCGQSARRWTAVHAVNGTIQTSDANLKKDIQPLDSGLAIMSLLQPVSFKWKSNNTDNGKVHLGFLAQNLQEVLPEVVYDEELQVNTETGDPTWQKTETLGVNYAEITPVLVKAIQEQQELIEQQQATIDELLDRVNELESGDN